VIPEYTRQAVAAIRAAVEEQQDFPGWLSIVLATVAKDLPYGAYSLIEGRPGSWEAPHVERLADVPVTFDLPEHPQD
jgi:hypothetical protein